MICSFKLSTAAAVRIAGELFLLNHQVTEVTCIQDDGLRRQQLVWQNFRIKEGWEGVEGISMYKMGPYQL